MPNTTVKVTVTQATANDPFSITVDPFVLDLAGGPAALRIEWELDNSHAPDWQFSTPTWNSRPGIRIRRHFGRFEHGGKSMNKYVWNRKPSANDGVTYQYSINLVRTTDGLTATLDPFVINR